MHRTRLATTLAGLAALAALSGCSDSDSDSTSGDRSVSVSAERAPQADPTHHSGDHAAAEVDAVDDAADAGARSGAEEAPDRVDPGTTSVISTGTVSLEAEDVGKARLEVRKIVDQHQGSVTDQETSTGDEGEVDAARLVLRVPSARFSDVTAALEDVATLTGSTAAAEDVTTEVIDIEARIRAQRKSVLRIEALLARADSIEQIVAIESQLSTRQADLDSLISRQQWLADQTSLSTINVYIEQVDKEEATEETEETEGFLAGLSDGWDGFVGSVVGVLTVLGFLLPWLVLVAVAVVPVWLAVRRRLRGSSVTTRPTPPAAPTA